MQIKKSKQLFHVTLVFKNEMTRNVTVKAGDREAAERRALKFNPAAIRVKRDVA